MTDKFDDGGPPCRVLRGTLGVMVAAFILAVVSISEMAMR
jgi:hypothetical protein